MVDESLKQHFKTHTCLDKTQIDELFIEGKNKLAEQQIKTVINTIDTLKILDPAVGSGAYPMGILQRLIFILDKIDPENTHFKQQQIAKAESMDEASKKASIEAIEKVFDQANQHNAYGKKLMLIENCIYGVDIQAIAIQICKLRFFISLTIEQHANNDKANNYGIKALPNLETKFIAANTLLPLGKIKTKQSDLFDDGIVELQQNLATVRHQYFSAKTLKTKRKYRDEDKRLRQQMLEKLKHSNPETQEAMSRVVHWDLYNQNAISDWFDSQWMFGIKDGFDIVLGNPPYIRQESIKQFKTQFKQNFSVYTGTADIYTYFYEKGFNLLSKNGHLCYITSNKWMRAKYGEKLRYFFKHNTKLKQIIDFEGKQIFENATVDTNILLCGKSGDDENFTYQKQLPDKNNPLFTMNSKDLSKNAYTLQPPEILALKKKIERIGTPLTDWDININYGIKTGFNEAFIIDNDTKQVLCEQDPKSAEIIKPILRGRDIKAYEANWAGLWLINTHNGDKNNSAININDYPAVKNHFDQYYMQLEKRCDQGKTPYNLRDCAYLAEFEKEKIVYPCIMAKRSSFFLDIKKTYPPAPANIITGNNLKYLIGVLNSSLIYFLFRKFYMGGGIDGELKTNNLKKLPIPKIPKPAQQPFIDLVDKILIAKQDGTDTTALETQIDQKVYQLYNLTADDIKIIEGQK